MSGAKVAAYLRGDGGPAKPAGEKILERLAKPAPASAPVPPVQEQPAEAVDQSKLAALARPAEAPPKPIEKSESEKPEELEKANEKLAGLVKPK